MIYFVVRQLLRITIRVFFKHIHVSHVDYIPYNKPLVIAANHPGAFLDPVLIACLIRKPIYFLVRGDVFKNKLIRIIFEQFNMIPVYRKDEGFGNIEKNHDTNSRVTDILKRKGIVVIFCEGYSAVNRRLLPVLKGTARVCMLTAVNENLDVQIVPAGISYSHKTNFRKEVMIDFSASIAMKDYLNDYAEHPQKSFVKITTELTHRLEKDFLVIKDPVLDEITETHLNYYRNKMHLPFLPIMVRNDSKFIAEQRISDFINDLHETDKPRFELLKKQTRHYEEMLQQQQCDDRSIIIQPEIRKDIILLIFGLPLFIIGFLCWGIPYIIAKLIADKKVSRVDFHDSLTLNVTNVLFGLFVLFYSILLIPFIGIYAFLLYPIAPPLSIISGWYFDKFIGLVKSLRTYSKRRLLLPFRPVIPGIS